MGRTEILNTFNIKGDAILHKWIEQYLKFCTCIDNRGRFTKPQNPNKVHPN